MLKTSWYRLILLLPLFICMLLCKSAWAENEDRSITSEDGVYTYSMNEDGSVTLCSFDWKTHQTGDDVIVPSMVDGHVVSEIGAKCYARNNRATIGTLVIPNSIRSIEALAFFELEINHISIPASVEVIEQGAFVTEYTSISVAKGCPDYTAVKGGLYEKSTKTLLAAAHQGVEILDGIRNIGAYACYAIEPETVALSRIPASVEAIGNHAFFTAQLMCAADEAYHIPAATIEEYAFSKAVFKRPYSGNVEITFDEQLTALPAGCFSEPLQSGIVM